MKLRSTLMACACVLALANAAGAEPAPAGPIPLVPAAEAAAAQTSAPEAAPVDAAATPELDPAVQAIVASLVKRHGDIKIADNKVTLKVPEGFYYLDPKDSETVLHNLWGNPPNEPSEGMLFKTGMEPTDSDSWGVVLTYDKLGYVSDADANKTDYAKLLAEMQKSTKENSDARVKEGYDAMQLVGWAQPPKYDAVAHKLVWAKELAIGTFPDHTLNYDMRVLGREGVLSMNFISGMSQLAEIEAASAEVLAIPSFAPGARYEDFNASTDKKADIGLAGLIFGGGAAAVIAKKVGLIAILAKFGKVIFVAIVGGFAVVGRFLKGLFSKKPKEAEAIAGDEIP